MDKELKYPFAGYAPGHYHCNCSVCEDSFQGDKRAVTCEPCAIKLMSEYEEDMKENPCPTLANMVAETAMDEAIRFGMWLTGGNKNVIIDWFNKWKEDGER